MINPQRSFPNLKQIYNTSSNPELHSSTWAPEFLEVDIELVNNNRQQYYLFVDTIINRYVWTRKRRGEEINKEVLFEDTEIDKGIEVDDRLIPDIIKFCHFNIKKALGFPGHESLSDTGNDASIFDLEANWVAIERIKKGEYTLAIQILLAECEYLWELNFKGIETLQDSSPNFLNEKEFNTFISEYLSIYRAQQDYPLSFTDFYNNIKIREYTEETNLDLNNLAHLLSIRTMAMELKKLQEG